MIQHQQITPYDKNIEKEKENHTSPPFPSTSSHLRDQGN